MEFQNEMRRETMTNQNENEMGNETEKSFITTLGIRRIECYVRRII